MKTRVLTAIMILLFLTSITPITVSVGAKPATKTAFTGSCTASSTAPGESWIVGDIIHVKGGQGEGLASGDLPGVMEFTLTGSVNLKTGKGSAHGKWVFIATDDKGTFEGTWRTTGWDMIWFEGTAVAHGTGDYEGMLWSAVFWGYNLYWTGYEGPDGIYYDMEGIILSPQGEPLP